MPKGVYVHKLPPPSRKGSHMTEEFKQHMSKIMLERFKTQDQWNKGKRDLTAKKYNKILKGISPNTIANISNLNKGKFGKDHPKWTENKKRPFQKAIRQLFKYVEWRTTIFTRDNFTCVLCNATKVYVEADHFPVRFIDILNKNKIETFDQALACEELWDISNGRTLCKPCHLKTITWGRKPRLQKTN